MPELIISKPDGSATRVILNPVCRWKQAIISGCDLHYTGDGLNVAEKINNAFGQKDSAESLISDILAAQTSMSSGIFFIEDTAIAWVDHIRSFPVFYTAGPEKALISNDARLILSSLGSAEIDETSLLEFCTAGFVTGSDTLYKEIKCLQPGEFLFHRGDDEILNPRRYYQYRPLPDTTLNAESNILQLGNILDKIIVDVIKRAGGRPIWVPLSAGLDSRIILCKLHEHGYQNLHTFTYGPKYNFEALHASKVAKTLNVPWHYIDLNSAECRRIFKEKSRKEYSDFADGLKTAPSFREFTALKSAKQKNLIPADAIIINGQSGDFITGGHVAPLWFEKVSHTKDDLLNIILQKHYTLWKGLLSEQSKDVIANKITSIIPNPKMPFDFSFASAEETWEYDARQVVLVVNGQRSYDFFGYDWELPLWEKTLCDFFERVPYQQKENQSLFKAYLKRYNYKGLFSSQPKIWRWTVPMLWVLPIAKLIGGFSKHLKRDFYALMRYYGHYSNQYAFFPLGLHIKTYRSARNIFSLYVRHWLIENHIPLNENMKKEMEIFSDR